MNVIETLRDSLQPQGTKPVVRLHLSGAAYFDKEFVDKCIDQLEAKANAVASGLDGFTPLELLAVAVLKDSSGIE